MRFPLVWRAELDAAVRERNHAQSARDAAIASGAAARAEAADLRAALDIERARYDSLLQTVLAMKQSGATVVPVQSGVVEPPTATAVTPDELQALIADVCGEDVRKRRMMLRQLKADRARGRNDDDIRKEIEHGIQSDGVPA